jgi:hypothetical protein
MKIFIYRDRFITDDEQTMDDLIFNKLSEQDQFPSDEQVASEYEDKVEEVQVNPQDLFSYMKQGYIFDAYCGSE